MGGEDSGLLALELPGQPMTNLYLLVLGPGDDEAASDLSVGDLERRVAERLDYLPALRWRLAPVPLGLHHPMWVDDAGFELAAHLAHVRLAEPGGASELAALCDRLLEEPLDRSRPLWHVTLVDGLSAGRQALIWRAHHCLVDGAATVTTFGRFFAEGEELEALRRAPFAPGASPRRMSLLAGALRDQAVNLRSLRALVARTRRAMRARAAHERAAGVTLPRASHDVPPCSLNEAFAPGRRMAMAELELETLERVRDEAGVTFTDVALAVVSGALRSMLVRAGELPGRPLVAACTVSLEGPQAAQRHWGNRFCSVTTTLATHVEDPWARLLEIGRVTGVARASNEILGDELWEEWLSRVPPMVTRRVLRRHHHRCRARRELVNANVTVSSIPGPARRWRLGPNVVERVWLTGPPNNGVGATVVLFTYGGSVFVGVNSVQGSIAEPEHLAAAFAEATEELVEEATRRAGAPARRR